MPSIRTLSPISSVTSVLRTRLLCSTIPSTAKTPRRRQTVHEITKLAGQCAQVLVLSHDATFLKQLWDKAALSQFEI